MNNNIQWHHGTCDCCKRKNILILHFGYNTQKERDYRICLECFSNDIHIILYGYLSYSADAEDKSFGLK